MRQPTLIETLTLDVSERKALHVNQLLRDNVDGSAQCLLFGYYEKREHRRRERLSSARGLGTAHVRDRFSPPLFGGPTPSLELAS